MTNPIPYSLMHLPDKNILSLKNKTWKSYYPGNEYEIKMLEEKFGDLIYTPLDIPRIEVPDNFYDFFFKNAKFAHKRLKDSASSAAPNLDTEQNSAFLSIDSTQTKDNSIWSKNFVSGLISSYKFIFDQINEYLPLNSPITEFSLWSSTKQIPFHRDESSFLDMPTQFRVMLKDPGAGNDTMLRLQNHSPIQEERKTSKCIIPQDTNSFVWNNLRALHGSNITENKKILFIPIGILDINWKRYNELLERSFLKYKSNIVLDNFKRSDYIDD